MGIGPGEYTMGSGIPDPDGPTYDPFKWGGRGQDMRNSVYTPGTSGADQDVNRYRQLGGQYGGAAAPGIDRGLSSGSRGYQNEGLGLMRNAAYGGAPSRAEIYGQKLTDDSIDTAMSVGASARGGALSQAAAMGQAQAASAQQRAAGARDLSALRAQEMAQARGDFYGAASGMRQQDIGVENYATDNEARQRAMNQADRQFYEQRAWDTRKQEQDNTLRREQVGNEGWANERKLALESEENDWGKVKDVASGVGSFIGGIFSDVRAKEDVYPIGGSGGGGLVRDNPYGSDVNLMRENPYGAGAAGPASPSAFGVGAGAVGGGFSAFGGGARSAFAPIRSDARSKYIVSDANAKREAFEEGAKYADASHAGITIKAPAYATAPAAAPKENKGPTTADARKLHDAATSLPMALSPSAAPYNALYGPVRETYQATTEAKPEEARAAFAVPPVARDAAFSALGPVAGPAMRYVVSDEKAKVIDLDEGTDRSTMRDGSSDSRTNSFDKSFHRDSKADQKRVKRAFEDKASKDADEMMAGYGASLARGASVKDPIADANRAQASSVYAYKPEFTPPEQQPGEQNVGPMAQTMASDPVASTAVKQTPDGMLMLDSAKLAKLHSAGIASLQEQIDELGRRYGRGR